MSPQRDIVMFSVYFQDGICYEVRSQSTPIKLALNIRFSQLLRWNTVTPMGLAHYCAQDDEYKGYRIPKVIYMLI